jgi:hypothetical protein
MAGGKIMKTKLVIATLLAGSSLFAGTRFSIGVGIGNGYGAPAPAYSAYRPACPGPDYAWVDGYWDNAGPRRLWHDGYWARQTFARSFVAPHRNDRDRFDGRSNFSDRDGDHRR